MKAVVKDALPGLAVVILITVAEFLVTLPFGEPGELSQKNYWALVNREYLLTAVPAFLITFAFAALLRTGSRGDALRRGIVWVAVLVLSDVLIGIGNQNFAVLFTTIGIYAKYVCAFAGPVAFGRIRRL